MEHRTNENFLVSEQKVLFDRSWKLKLLIAHSEFLIWLTICGSFRVRSTNCLLNLRDPPPILMKFGTLADNA